MYTGTVFFLLKHGVGLLVNDIVENTANVY